MITYRLIESDFDGTYMRGKMCVSGMEDYPETLYPITSPFSLDDWYMFKSWLSEYTTTEVYSYDALYYMFKKDMRL